MFVVSMALAFRFVHWLASFAAITLFFKSVQAQHSVQLTNNCGFGTATLDQIPSDTLATGSQVFTNTTIQGVAFLNTGLCGPNGGNCTAVDISLGSGSTNTVVVDLIPTHVFSVPVEFSFYNACDGAGVSCLTSDCVNAIRDPSEDSGEVICNADGANVLVTFCPSFNTTSGQSSMRASSTSAISSSIITSSDIPPTSSIATNMTSAATSSHHLLSSTIDAIVGSVVGVFALIIFGGLLLCLRRRRMQAEVSHDTIPEPYFLPPSASTLNNHTLTPNRLTSPASSQLKPVISESGRSETSSHYNHYGDTEEGRRRPLQGAPVEGPALDSIVERLAERFGWIAPPPSTGNHDDLPVYHPS